MCGGTRTVCLPARRRNLAYSILAAAFWAAATALPGSARADDGATKPAARVAGQTAATGNSATGNSATGNSAAGNSAAANSTAAGWIKQLGDDRFEVREEASRRLSQMNIEIEPALETALHNPDPEIRVRVRRVLDTIRKADLERRLTAFAEDANDTKHLDLPGWSRYRQVVGSVGPARRLFVEMQRAEPGLFRAVEEGPQATGTALENCIAQEMLQMRTGIRIPRGSQVSLGTVTAMLFVGSDKHVSIADDMAMQMVFMTNQPAIQMAVNNNSQAATVKKILGAWVSRDASANVLAQNLWLATRYDLKEGVEPAVNALRQGNQPMQIKQVALMLIGKLGDKSNLPAVETCLKDTDVCFQGMMNNQQFQTQLRDVALAVAIHLQGQDPKAFGFDRLDMTNGWPYYNPASIGFRTAADRDAATKKWADWTAAHRVTADASTHTKKS